MLKLLALATLGLLMFEGEALAVCTSYPYTPANGTTADASQVMANFNCAALTSGATLNGTTFTGATAFPGSTSINSGGAVGIGMTPVNILDITQSLNGDAWIGINNPNSGSSAAAGLLLNGPTGTSAAFFLYGSNVTGGPGAKAAVLQGSNANLYLTSGGTSAPVIFGINYSEVGRFGTDGSFLVGTTTNSGWTGSANVELRGGTSRYPLSLYQTGTGTFAEITRVDNTSDGFVDFRYGSTQVGTITTSGTSTTYNTTSDARLKTISSGQQNYREAIAQLWVGDFVWKSTHKADFGVIAQQAYPLFPEAVAKPAREEDTWEVDYGKLAPLALWGVKDLYQDTEKQARQITELQAKVQSLTKAISALQQVNTANDFVPHSAIAESALR